MVYLVYHVYHVYMGNGIGGCEVEPIFVFSKEVNVEKKIAADSHHSRLGSWKRPLCQLCHNQQVHLSVSTIPKMVIQKRNHLFCT